MAWCSMPARKTSERRRERRKLLTIRGGRPYALRAQKHGSTSTYVNWHCRCVPCTKAHSAAVKVERMKRGATRMEVDGRLVAVTAPQHGTIGSYINWMCRCPRCTTAMVDRVEDRREHR